VENGYLGDGKLQLSDFKDAADMIGDKIDDMLTKKE
jgi:hypothetical protein